MTNNLEYTHLELNKEVSSIAGYYTPFKEVAIPHDGKEVLYVLGQAVIESSCCGAGSWAYVLVPGYIVNWQSETNEADLPVSEIEPISDEVSRNNIRKTIKEIEVTSQIEFW